MCLEPATLSLVHASIDIIIDPLISLDSLPPFPPSLPPSFPF